MIKAVLLDLDETLLRVDIARFGETYLNSLAAWLHQRLPGLDLSVAARAVRAAEDMVGTLLDPTRTLWQAYLSDLAACLGLPGANGLAEIVAGYFAGPYLDLAGVFQPLPFAGHLVAGLIAAGLKVVIATNPYFPLAAMRQRMAWAGLPAGGYGLISNIEEVHFVKPRQHFYEELLARIGVESDEAIMVGDNARNDIGPARQIGMATFYIEGGSEESGDPECDGRGTLADFAERVASGWLIELASRPLLPRTPAQVGPRMLGNTAALHGLMEAIPPSFWHMRPNPNEWTPLEIVCHMLNRERDVHRPSLERIAREGNPFITYPAPPFMPDNPSCPTDDPREVVAAFWHERQITLGFLAELPIGDWDRPARHSIFGPTSLLEMALFTTRHDRLHLSQLCQTVGQCREE